MSTNEKMSSRSSAPFLTFALQEETKDSYLFCEFPNFPNGSPAFPPSPVKMYKYPSRPNNSWPPLWFAAGSSISKMTLEVKITVKGSQRGRQLWFKLSECRHPGTGLFWLSCAAAELFVCSFLEIIVLSHPLFVPQWKN